MALMTWGAQYSVQVQKFDSDHQHLFAMINDLNEAMRAGKGKAVLKQVLLGLAAYTNQHFAAEEMAMKRTQYPGYAIHVEEHRKLTKKVEEFVREFEAGNALVSIDLLMFLRDWLEQHIKVTDRAYASHMNAHGIA